MAEIFLQNFIKIELVALDTKMFRIKFNAMTDGRTPARTDAGRKPGRDISSLSFGQWS